MRLTIMTPQRLKFLAALFLLLAIVFAWLGYQAKSTPVISPVSHHIPVSEAKFTVWKINADLSAGQLLTQDNVTPVSVANIEPNQIADLGLVLELRAKRTIISGTILTKGMFEKARPLVDELPVGYRALALKANEISTIGGHLKPGDRVDVLYVLRPNSESGLTTTARRLARNLEVLAVGSQVLDIHHNEPTEPNKNTSKTTSARSVVLAVPQSFAPELLLAESSGELRLSMVGNSESISLIEPLATVDDSTHLSAQPVLDQDALAQPVLDQHGLDASHAQQYLTDLKQFKPQPTPIKNAVKPTQTKRSSAHYIEIIQGDKRTWVNSNK